MFQKQLTAFAAIALLLGAAPRSETVLWEITPVATGGLAERLDLALHFRGDKDGETVVALPDEWAGERELYKALWDLRADGASIGPGAAASEITLSHTPGAPVSLYWKIGGGADAPPAKTGGNDYRPRFKADHFFVIGHTALPIPETVTDRTPARVKLYRPNGITVVSDLEHRRGRGAATFGALTESVIMGGDIRIIEAGGARLALTGRFDALDDAFWRDTFTRIARSQRAYWETGSEAFLVTVIAEPGEADSTSIGGTGLSDAFSIFATANTDAGIATSITSHEMIHTWIPGRLGRMPEENEATAYWLSEGFTDWVSFRTLTRSGLWTPDDFASAFNASLEGYDLSPKRDATGEDIAAGFWTSSDIGRLPYSKGMLIATWLDHEVRTRTKGRRDLDDVLLTMQKAARRDPDLPVEENLARSVKKIARWDAAAELRALSVGGAPVELAQDVLAPCGRMTASERPLWERGFDFAATARADWVITGVAEGSRAYEAGLRNGMQLTSWSEDSADLDPTKAKTAGVLDGSVTREISWLPQGRETRTVRRFELATGLSPADTAACRKRLAGN